MLGIASQVPSRHRNHNRYLRRWDGEGLSFDSGEGSQRQLSLASVAVNCVTRRCLSHFHGAVLVCRASCSVGTWTRCAATRYGRTSPPRARSSSPGCITAGAFHDVHAGAFHDVVDRREHAVDPDGPVAEGATRPSRRGAWTTPSMRSATGRSSPTVGTSRRSHWLTTPSRTRCLANCSGPVRFRWASEWSGRRTSASRHAGNDSRSSWTPGPTPITVLLMARTCWPGTGCGGLRWTNPWRGGVPLRGTRGAGPVARY